MVKRTFISVHLLYLFTAAFSQIDSSSASSASRSRIALVATSNAIFYAGSYVALNKAWYSEFEKTRFHFFDDNPEWNQMDKAGHVWSTYHVSRLSARVWEWGGLEHRDAVWVGAVSGIVYQGIIEMQDAYSAAWGFSWGDVAANFVGAGLFVGQDIGWKSQRVQVKMGYHPYDYPPPLISRRNTMFGKSLPERILKDYNSQTYWLTANIKSITGSQSVPAWLNVAVGYGAGGMYGGRTNVWTEDGRTYDFSHIRRSRKFYVSPDIDLSRIKVKSKALRSVLSVVNSFRIPLPALELDSGTLNMVIR